MIDTIDLLNLKIRVSAKDEEIIRRDEYNRIIGFLKYHQFAVIDNNGKYYSIEELEEELKKIIN